jgi:hypothetical protein
VFGGRLAAGLFAAAGLAAVALGAAPFVSARFRRFYLLMWASSPWTNGPAASAATVAIGVGIVCVGLGILLNEDTLIYLAFAAMIAGAVIYVANPAWLRPRWTSRPK